MANAIQIAYRRWHKVAPWFNWIKPRDSSNWWREFDQDEFVAVSSMKLTLGNDPLLSYKAVGDLEPSDRWLYELNWFYGDDLTSGSTILDEFIADDLLMQGLLSGNGYLVMNLSLEAWCQPSRINHIESFMRSKGIPPERVIYMTGALNAPELFTKHGYAMKPLPVMEFEMHASAKVKGGEIWTGERTSISRRFLSFNRIHRPHRLSLLCMLHSKNLLDHFKISFSRSIGGVDIMDYAERYMAHQTSDHDSLMAALRELGPRLPMVLDTDDWGPNLAHHHSSDAVSQLYQRTGISVITETTGYDEEIFFSEKTFHPIRYCQPFIMISAPGTLRYLRQLGYRTFGDWWDEGYDDIADHEQRVRAAVDQIDRVSRWSDARFDEFMLASRETCFHNLNVLISAVDNRNYSKILGDLFD